MSDIKTQNIGRLRKEYLFFKEQEPNMRILLETNMVFALILPIIEIFVGAYIMRNTSDPVAVAFYQLFMYIGIIATSFLNGYLLRNLNVKTLYAVGILVSGLSMFIMMQVKSLGFLELGIAGFFMGASSGFFWTNRYLLTLNSTTNENRNYFFGIESFFFSIGSITVPLIVGAFLSQIEGHTIFGIMVNINKAYQIVTFGVVLLSIIACIVLWKGKYTNPRKENFVYFRFISLWRKMLLLASLKGMVQGFLVTAPAILVLKLVGGEGALGITQGISGALTAVLVYVLGRIAQPKDRIKIFLSGILVFLIGTLFNGIMFSMVGVLIFVLCKVIFQPLFDLAYFPIMLRTIDATVKLEKRNEYTYILSHELGLFAGRAFGLILFIILAYWISEDFALKYSLITVAALQLLAYPLAQNIIKNSNKILKNYEGQ